MSFGISILGGSHPHCDGRISAILRNPNVSLVSVFDSNPQVSAAIAQKTGAKVASSPSEVLRSEESQLVLIEGRNYECSEFAILSAEAGKPMLLEKPGAENAARMQQVFDAVTQSGVFCQIGYHLRYSPSVAEAHKLLADGLIGRITTVRFHTAVMQPWLTSEWFCDPNDRGGMVHNDFCHMLDLLCSFFGRPQWHASKITKLEGVPEHLFEDSAVFALQFGDVLAAGDCCGWETNDWISTWDVQMFGTKGTIRMGIHPPVLETYFPEASGKYASGWSKHGDANFEGELNYDYELADVVAQVSQARPPGGSSVEDALEVQRLLERMYASSRL